MIQKPLTIYRSNIYYGKLPETPALPTRCDLSFCGHNATNSSGVELVEFGFSTSLIW